MCLLLAYGQVAVRLVKSQKTLMPLLMVVMETPSKPMRLTLDSGLPWLVLSTLKKIEATVVERCAFGMRRK